jgi:hypothetical protein
MPVVFRLDGMRFHFFSDEGNPREPVHIHVKAGRDEAKFWLSPNVRLAYNRGLSGPTLNRVQHLVEENRDELERTWNEFFS